MVTIRYTGDELWERIERAVEKIRNRVERVTAALERAGIGHALVGGNAVQHWVAQVDEAAVRNTRDVDILLRREDLPRVIEVLREAGFQFQQVSGIDLFLDGADATPRDAVHVVYAGEKVHPHYPIASPDVDQYEKIRDTRTLALESLVRMKLNSYRRKDQVHLLDMLEVGLIDQTWPAKLPEPLRERLQELIDSPDG